MSLYGSLFVVFWLYRLSERLLFGKGRRFFVWRFALKGL